LSSACRASPLRSLIPHSFPTRRSSDLVLYIIAGSEGLTGAAIMAARSAWAEGLGAAILVCPRGLLSVYEHSLPAIIKKPVGNSADLYFTEKHLREVQNITGQKEGSLLYGPGQ